MYLLLALMMGCNGASVDDTGGTPAPGEYVASDLPRDTDPDVSTETLHQLTADNRAFGLDLLQQLALSEQGNLFLSPHSISTAIAMNHAGAEGETERQTADALHFTLPEPDLHQAFNRLDLELASRAELPEHYDTDDPGFRLRVVNQLFGQVGTPFEEPFLDTLAVNYGAGLRLLDFVSDADGARTLINDWVEEQTEDRIVDLLPAGSIDALTRLVLVNAIYFKASWSAPFDPADTVDGAFTLRDGGTVTASMMNGVIDTTCGGGDGFSLVTVPYVGEQLDMTLLVPDAGAYDSVETGLTAASLDAALDGLDSCLLTLAMPRFGFRSSLNLNSPLQALGMVDAFSQNADFSGITTAEQLYITGVFHQAFVAVNEEGTEAAAATAVVDGTTSVPEEVTLDVDRPFLFFIRDRPTGAVLFMGRVLDPTA